MIRRPPTSTLFPTRRSSDLVGRTVLAEDHEQIEVRAGDELTAAQLTQPHDDRGDEAPGRVARHAVSRDERLQRQEPARREGDRKSTRLNSSHANISYAVFCL